VSSWVAPSSRRSEIPRISVCVQPDSVSKSERVSRERQTSKFCRRYRMTKRRHQYDRNTVWLSRLDMQVPVVSDGHAYRVAGTEMLGMSCVIAGVQRHVRYETGTDKMLDLHSVVLRCYAGPESPMVFFSSPDVVLSAVTPYVLAKEQGPSCKYGWYGAPSVMIRHGRIMLLMPTSIASAMCLFLSALHLALCSFGPTPCSLSAMELIVS
jgi:hypothetical protein